MSRVRAVLGAASVLIVLGLSLSAVAGLGAAIGPATPSPSSAPSYNVTFSESGLPAGSSWSVHVAFIGCGCSGVHETVSSTNASIVIALPNGSYHFHVLPVAGYVVVGPARGTVQVAGASPAPVAATFVPIVTYPVEFTESGLPAGTSWSVRVGGNGVGPIEALEDVSNRSTGSAINFSLPNATYHYTVAPVNGSFFSGPAHGSFIVAGASPAPIAVGFTTPPKYTVAFVETGLLAGASWSVALHNRGGTSVHESSTSTGSENVFYLPTGAYDFRIGSVLDYTLATAASGTLTVAGANVSVAVPFEAVGGFARYLFYVNETGLAPGTSWSVHLAIVHSFGRGGHTTESSTGSSISFALANGTYRYDVLPVRGYTLDGARGTIRVVGGPVGVAVTFSPIPTYAVTFNETGLPNGTNWSVLVHTQAAAGSAFPVRVTELGNTTELTFWVPNETFCYRILPVHGWRVDAATGSFVVAGASPATVYVVFTAK